MKKSISFNIKLTEQDMEKIKELREKYDVNISAFIRDHIRKVYKDTIKQSSD